MWRFSIMFAYTFLHTKINTRLKMSNYVCAIEDTCYAASNIYDVV